MHYTMFQRGLLLCQLYGKWRTEEDVFKSGPEDGVVRAGRDPYEMESTKGRKNQMLKEAFATAR